jgi:hypothetical protein
MLDSNVDGLDDGLAAHLNLSLISNDTDGDGVSNALELVNGTSPIRADTDGDGEPDNTDYLPLDPNSSYTSPPPQNPGDVLAPSIILQKPAGAALQ